MGYYRGDYYRGDYYGGRRGDPFLGAIGGIVAGLAKRAIPAIGGLIGRAGGTKVIGPVASGIAGTAMTMRATAPAPAGMKKVGGVKGVMQRALPGGQSGYYRSRRMNVTNVKALRRAGRRVKGFLKLARRLGALPVGGSGKKLFKAKRRR